MKKILCGIVSILLIISSFGMFFNNTSVVYADSDVMVSIDFEDGTSPFARGDTSILSVINTKAHTGNNCAYIAPTASGQKVRTEYYDLEANTDYTYSFWYCGRPGWTASRVGSPEKYDFVDNVFCGHGDEVTNWTYFEVSFNSESYSSFEFVFATGSEGYSFYVDDIQLVKGNSTLSSDTVLAEIDFEDSVRTFINGDGANNSANISTGNAHGGNKSLCFTPAYKNIKARSEFYNVEKNTEYKVSLWYKGTPGWAVVRIGAKAENSNINYDYTQSEKLGTDEEIAEWTYFEFVFNSGENVAIDIAFVLGSQAKYTFYVDDIKLVKNVKEVPTDTIAEIDFDDGDNPFTRGDGASITSISQDNPHSTGNCLYIQPAAKEQKARTQYYDIVPNTDYTVSFWYRGKPGWAALRIGAYDNNLTGNYEQAQTIFYASDSVVSNWTYAELDFNSGEYTKAELVFITSGSEFKFYIDDIKFAKKVEEAPSNTIADINFDKGINPFTKGNGASITSISQDNPHSAGNCLYITPTAKEQKARAQYYDVEPNTDYTVSFWYRGKPGWAALRIGAYDNNLTGNFEHSQTIFHANDTEVSKWTYASLTFNSESYTKVELVFVPGNVGYNFYVDDVKFEKGIIAPPEKDDEEDENPDNLVFPTLVSEMPMYIPGTYTRAKYVSPDDKNLLKNGGFEDGTEALADTLFNKYVKATTDTYATHSGSRGAVFKAEGDSEVNAVFKMSVEKNTEYLFGMWIRNELYSPDNTNIINWGISVPGSSEFVFKETIPAADGVWHLVCYSFNSQDYSEVTLMIRGRRTLLYIDDMYLCKTSDMIQYIAPESTIVEPTVTNKNPELLGCDNEDNLFKNFKLSNSNEYWNDVKGSVWDNQLSIVDTGSSSYGNALYYLENKSAKGKADPTGAYYIKFIDVEPNTEYTFSANYSIVKACADNQIGTSHFGFINTNRKLPTEICRFTFDSANFIEDCSWQTAGVSFKTGDYNRVAFVVLDCGGEAYIDNLRIFKTSDAKELELIKESPAENIESKVYSLSNGTVTGITAGITVKQLINTFEKSERLAVYDLNGEKMNMNDIVLTGAELRLLDGPVIKDRATLIVKGDVDGNGKVDTNDTELILAYLVGKENFDATAKSAADYDSNGTINIYDTVLNGKLAGKNGDMTVSFVAPTNISVNEEFKVYIKVSGGVSALSGGINYDKNHIILNNIELCDQNGWLLDYEHNDNGIVFAATSGKGEGIKKDVSLICLTFETDMVKNGAPEITVNNIRVTDGKNLISAKNAEWSYTVTDTPDNSQQNNTGNSNSTQQTITIVDSTLRDADNNLLESLIIDGVTFTPEFDPEIKTYEATVPFEIKSVTVKATAQSETAQITIEDTELTYVGRNIVKIIVLSESGLKRTYKVYITRQAPVKTDKVLQSNNIWIYVIIAAAVLLGATATTLIILYKKKKRNN